MADVGETLRKGLLRLCVLGWLIFFILHKCSCSGVQVGTLREGLWWVERDAQWAGPLGSLRHVFLWARTVPCPGGRKLRAGCDGGRAREQELRPPALSEVRKASPLQGFFKMINCLISLEQLPFRGAGETTDVLQRSSGRVSRTLCLQGLSELMGWLPLPVRG